MTRNWPETFTARGIGNGTTAWEESAPGCWVGTTGMNGAAHICVVDDASGNMVAVQNTTQPLPIASSMWFRMAVTLGDVLIERGYAVTCGAEECEHRRWPCPVRVAYAIPTPIGASAVDTSNATEHRPVSAGRIEVTDG